MQPHGLVHSMLTLGIPPNAVMALMVGAMTIHGIVPGPVVMTKQPGFSGDDASMWLGNLILVVISLPLVGCGQACARPNALPSSSCSAASAFIPSTTRRPMWSSPRFRRSDASSSSTTSSRRPAARLRAGPLMEENLRRAMLVARGDATRVLHASDLRGL
jgi:putative tricarboxylic transport membrane protein